MIYKAGKTSQSIDVFIADDNGKGVTGLTYSTVLTNIPSLAYSMGDNTAAVAITPVTLAAITTAWASSGFIERSQGWYRFDMPNAMLATAGKSPKIIGDAAGYHLIHEAITVVAYDPQDADALGIAKFSALPSYPSGTSGGLPVLQQVDSSHLFVDAYLRQGWTLQITSPTFSIGDTTLYNPDTLQPGSVFRIWSTAGGFAAGEDVYVVDNANTVVRGYNHTTEQDWAIGDNLSFVGFSAPNMVEILNGQGLTTTRAAKLDNADVAVSTIKAKTDTIPASPAAVGSAMTLADGAITAGKIAASALDGKGDWLLSDDYTEPTTPPTAEAIADAVADAIINAGGAISLSVQSPVLTSSSVQLVQGDSYYVADSRALSWTLSGGPSLVGATATLNAISNSDGTTALGVAGSISGSTITVELASSDTSGLQIGTEAYTFNVTITLANGHIFTPIVGTIQVFQSAR